jgi:hypothetical protein
MPPRTAAAGADPRRAGSADLGGFSLERNGSRRGTEGSICTHRSGASQQANPRNIRRSAQIRGATTS